MPTREIRLTGGGPWGFGLSSRLKVSAVAEGGKAAKGGIRCGDLILEINGKSIHGSISEALMLIRMAGDTLVLKVTNEVSGDIDLPPAANKMPSLLPSTLSPPTRATVADHGDMMPSLRLLSSPIPPTTVRRTTSTMASPTTSKKCPFLMELTSRLKLLMSMPSSSKQADNAKVILMKNAVESFITQGIQSKVDVDVILECLENIYSSDLLISKEVYEWAKEQIVSTHSIMNISESGDATKEETMPLYCEDTIYHASLCSYAVCTKGSSDYQELLSKFEHHFEQLSVSTADSAEQYIIARKGKTYFVAFLSEPSFSQWIENESVQLGIDVQSSRIPLRFFIQQLHNGYRIVCTGFAFGSLLALSVTASLWNQHLFSTEFLKKNLCCIRFSPILVNLPVLEEVNIEIKSTIHTILLKDDFVSYISVLFYWLSGEVYYSLLNDMAFLQNIWNCNYDASQSGIKRTLFRLKKILRRVLPRLLERADNDIDFVGSFYLMSARSSDIDDISKEKMIDVLKAMDVNSLTVQSLFENGAESYHMVISKSIGKDFSTTSPSPIPALDVAQPLIDSVLYHQFDNHHASVIITGNNFWFCNELKIGSNILKCLEGSQKALLCDYCGQSSVIEVKSNFFKPVLYTNSFIEDQFQLNFSQQQVSRLAPAEIIKIGYLSALLEQLPFTSSNFSRRFETVREFLFDLENMVPLESFVRAISLAEDLDTTHRLCKQLMSLRTTLPSSFTMQSALESAASHIAHYNLHEYDQLREILEEIGSGVEAINGMSLNFIYHLNMTGKSEFLSSSLPILRHGRERIRMLTQSSILNDASESPLELSESDNVILLETVNKIFSHEITMCSLLLGAFMEEKIRILFMKTPSSAKTLEIVSEAAVGTWALFGMTIKDVEEILDSSSSKSLVVEVGEHIKSDFGQEIVQFDKMYAGKLQFLIQCISPAVCYHTECVSYSLECQLIKLCQTLNISWATSLENLVSYWDEIFQGTVMSLIIPSYRSLIARWLKWSLMVHHLREELAHCTTAGVVGLVNSGKSLLVNKLFDIKISMGTTAASRTTVPFLYNLNGLVDGLDVIDFPGVDDRDDRIPDLAKLLLDIARVVVFVVDYRRAHTESTKIWLQLLQKKAVPVLVCLSHADKLYAEYMNALDPHFIKKQIVIEKEHLLEQLGSTSFSTVEYFSFTQNRDSILNSTEGRKQLQAAGIKGTQDVGDWLADTLEQHLDQDKMAHELRVFLHRQENEDTNPQQLTMSDCRSVTRHLEDLSHEELISLGTELGLKYPRMRRMTSLMGDLVEAWLNGVDDVLTTSGPPSWASLIRALGNIGQHGISQRITEGMKSKHRIMEAEKVPSVSSELMSSDLTDFLDFQQEVPPWEHHLRKRHLKKKEKKEVDKLISSVYDFKLPAKIEPTASPFSTTTTAGNTLGSPEMNIPKRKTENDSAVVGAESSGEHIDMAADLAGLSTLSTSQVASSVLIESIRKHASRKPKRERCAVCNKVVHSMERLEVDSVVYHKICFKCSVCYKHLSPGTYSTLQGKIYCKAHFKQLFKRKGNYDEGFSREQHKTRWVKEDKEAESEEEEQ